MLCDLVETGKVGGNTAILLWYSWHVCVCVCAGDMLPVLAFQWLPHSWRVHCGPDPGGKALRIHSQKPLHRQQQGTYLHRHHKLWTQLKQLIGIPKEKIRGKVTCQ